MIHRYQNPLLYLNHGRYLRLQENATCTHVYVVCILYKIGYYLSRSITTGYKLYTSWCTLKVISTTPRVVNEWATWITHVHIDAFCFCTFIKIISPFNKWDWDEKLLLILPFLSQHFANLIKILTSLFL